MSFMLLGILNSQASGGGAAAYELIETVTLANNTTPTVTFSSIPADYKHLQIRASVQSTNSNSADDVMTLTMNGNTSAVYTWHWLQGNGSSVSSAGYTSRNYIRLDTIDTTRFSSVSFTPVVMDILDYANTSKNTTVRYLHGNKGANTQIVKLASGLYQATNAVASMTFTGSLAGYNFTAGSRLSLYGVR